MFFLERRIDKQHPRHRHRQSEHLLLPSPSSPLTSLEYGRTGQRLTLTPWIFCLSSWVYDGAG